MNSLNKIFFIPLFFVTFLTSCTVPVSPPLPRIEDLGIVTSDEEAIDTDCSYFYFLWGKTAEVEGRYDEAIEAYEKAIVCDDSAEYVIRRLVVLLAKVNKKRQALIWIDTLVQKHPNDISTKLFLANLYAAIGEYEKSRDIYINVLTQDPKNSEAMLMLASLSIKEVDYSKGLEILERLVFIDPDSVIAYQYLAKLYRELHYNDKSLAAYQRTLSLEWRNAIAMEAADLYTELGKYKEAINLYQKVIKNDYINELAVGRLVILYEKTGEVDKALDILHELRKSTMDPQKVDLALGRVFLNQKRYDEAISVYHGMLEMYPDIDLVQSILALTYYEKGEKHKAKELLLHIPKDSEGYRDSQVVLLNILREEGNYTDAIKLVKENLVAEEGKEDFDLYAVLADLYKANGENDKALTVFKEAIRDSPDSPELYFRYGMFLDGIGRYAEAMTTIEKVLDLDPENPFALNYLGYTWADRGENLDKALEYIKKAVQLKPEDGFIRDSLGWVYFKRGDLPNALVELKKARLAEPDDPTIIEHYADALFQDGQKSEALKMYKKSLEIFTKEKDLSRVREKIKSINF